jgi:hypothetical protein
MPMRSSNTTMTIAEYSEQLRNKQIMVNRDYQRTDRVWPVSAKSNLIDTILNGYPLPKLILSQTTDLDTRRTRKEVVDGQQRTAAIQEFYENRYALTRGDFAGRRFEELDDANKRDFISYELAIDLFATASDEEIREVFRRINSYQVPLNKQETRHATHQGEFKWFMRDQAAKYASSLLKMGIVTEKQISRMGDLEFLTDLVYLIKFGIKTASPKALDNLYSQNDRLFPDKDQVAQKLDYGLGSIINLSELHRGPLNSRGNAFSLFAALVAVGYPDSPVALSVIGGAQPLAFAPREVMMSNLGLLSDALEGDGNEFPEFAAASKQGTNTEKTRKTRAQWLYRALTNTL